MSQPGKRVVDRSSATSESGDREAGDPGSQPRFHADFGVALIIVVFCAAAFYLTTTFEEVPSSLAQGMQPADFPRLILGLILVLTGIVVLQAWGQHGAKRRHVPGMVYLTILGMIAFLLIGQWIDLFIGITVFCIVIPLLWGARRYTLVIAYAVLLPVAIFVLFSIVLEVRFPRGMLTNLVY